jgi:hypothetical protein
LEEYLEEFWKPYTKIASVNHWKNSFKSERYENSCLKFLVKFCREFNMSPDELVQTRIEELRSGDQLVRATAEDRILAYHKKLSKETPGIAIMFRKMKSFYRANYVPLDTRVYLLTLAESCGRLGAVADLRWKDIKS